MEGNDELLRMELTELNSYTRHHLQLFISWFTFFLTVNFLAIGWFTSVLLTGALKNSLPVIFITVFFAVQIILSYVATLQVQGYFQITHDRCAEIIRMLAKEGGRRPATAIPLPIYLNVLRLMSYTLVSFVFFWIALALVAIYLVPL